jgi:hypothetical protein
MNIRDIPMGEFVRKVDDRHQDHGHPGHTHFGRRAMSRRQFARTAAGAAVVGATLGSGLWRPGVAEAGSFQPIPIPGGTPALGGIFHVFGPAPVQGDPADAEPVTITDFKGFIGLAYISGTVTQTNTTTGEILTLPFVDSDMRFMKGVFRGTDGRLHQGAFAFV